MTLGVFGGTFNPIHLGHLRAAEEVAEWLGLARILFVPSADPPHRHGRDEVLAPARLRYAWVEAAVADNERFVADALELERPGPSYSVDTLATLGARLAPEKPVFVIGDEAFAELAAWREPERLLTLAHFAVMARPPRKGRAPTGCLGDCLPAELAHGVELEPDGLRGRIPAGDTWIRLLEIAALDVSATDVRERLRNGRSVRYLVPESVRSAIVESGVYAESRLEAGRTNEEVATG
jgi:nicotinate-nucleotide adenylyltransferase